MSCRCGNGAVYPNVAGKYYFGEGSGDEGIALCLECWRDPKSDLHKKVIPEMGIDKFLDDVGTYHFHDHDFDLIDQYKVLDRKNTHWYDARQKNKKRKKRFKKILAKLSKDDVKFLKENTELHYSI